MMNKIHQSLNRVSVITAIIIVVCLHFTLVHAKPGPLAQSPLFLGNKVPPNIFFALDDSGSMDWETTQNAGAENPGGRSDQRTIDFTPDNDEERRDMCVGFNVMAYNPNFEYTPWRGKDDSGNTYQDMNDLDEALHNPYYTDDDSGGEDDISGHRYFPWNDADGDGEYDGPASTDVDANWDSTDECAVDDNSDGILVSTLPATGTPANPNSQQNYANYYSYYRKREFVAKRAISELIWNSDDRMGLATMHNHNSVGTRVEDMSNNTKKQALLNELGQVNSDNGTPLRLLLRNVGRYYDQAGSNSDHSALGFTDPSPILSASQGGTCQQNFTVLFSDGFWNGGDPGVGNDDIDGAGPWDGGSMADAISNTAADVAMQYYETDLATSLANNVPTIPNVDENDEQHMVTFTVAFGVNGTLTAGPTDRTTPFPWPDPTDTEDGERIDDLRHAAWNSRGEFLSARDPATLISSLEGALNAIADREGSAAAVSFNANSLQAGTQIFLSKFNTEGWTGDVLAFDLDVNTGALAATPAWEAQSILDARDITTSPRDIYTYNGSDGVFFDWASISNAHKDDLRTNPDSSTSSDAVAQARLAFLAGDRSNESPNGLSLRARNSRMGDYVHSAPQYAGIPQDGLPDADPFGATGNRFSDFVKSTAIQSRKPMVYTGSNDGTLHGLDAVNGDEEMAYIANFLFSTNPASGMHYLTDPNYSHTYYNDLSMNIKSTYNKISPSGTSDWRSTLVGGVRGGGRGLFALDVTDPNDFTTTATDIQDIVMWEFDSTDDPDLGFTFSEPNIVMLNNNKWGVIFGNGYNNTGSSGEAAVFILLLEGNLDPAASGLHGPWTLGTNYFKLSTGVGSFTDPNGMSTMTVVDLDNNFTADRIYGGDLEGNLWVFDISDANPSNWDSAYKTGSVAEPLFNTVSDKPITVRPAVTRVNGIPTTASNYPNVMVYFGTGQYLTTSDLADTTIHEFYGVWDTAHGNGNLTVSDLVLQPMAYDATLTDTRFVTENPVTYSATPSAGDFGWYTTFLDTGERVIIEPVARAGLVFFATLIPDAAACTPGGGDGFIMAFNALNGFQPPKGALDINNDGVVDYGDKNSSGEYAVGKKFLGVGSPAGLSFLGNRLYITDTGSITPQIEDVVDPNPGANGRLSWQEIVFD